MSRARSMLLQSLGAFISLLVRTYRLPYLHGTLRSIGHTLQGFFKDDCHIMSAAISFYAVLSLIPFLLLVFSITGYVINNLSQDPTSQHQLFTHLEGTIRAVVPFLTSDVLDRLRDMTLHRQALGISGLLILVITSALVFRTLELAFARIFKTRRRSMVVSHLLFVVFVLALGMILLLVHFVGVLSSSFFSARDLSFSQALESFLSAHAVARVALTVVTASLVFAVLLRYFSKRKLQFRYVFAGGLLFSILWMLAARLFGYYLTHIAQFSLLYGSMATLAIIVVWVFYSAIILLLCAEFTRDLQEYRLSLKDRKYQPDATQ